MSEQAAPSSMNALLARIEGSRIIVPDAAIAEIIDFRPTMSESDDMPTWYLGQLAWRSISIPLISLEAINNDSFFNQSKLLKIIVLHGVFNRDVLPYWAFVSLETPKMTRINASEMEKGDAESLGKVEAMKAKYMDELFIVPDLEKIESEMVNLLDLHNTTR